MATQSEALDKKRAKIAAQEELIKAKELALRVEQQKAKALEKKIKSALWTMIGRGIDDADDLTPREREVVKGILGRRKWKDWERSSLGDWLPAGSGNPDERGVSGDGSPSTPGQNIPDAVNLPSGSPAAAG